MKKCNICCVEKELHNFNFRKDSGNYRPYCKSCQAIKEKEYRDFKRVNDPEWFEKVKNDSADRYKNRSESEIAKVKLSNKLRQRAILRIREEEFVAVNGVSKKEYSLNKRKEKFIADSIAKHGDLYDYSRIDFKTHHVKVEIGCRRCSNFFFQTPDNHKSGKGCLICNIGNIGKALRSNTTDFISKARKIHGNKYSYNKVNYIKNSMHVDITCPTHGDFSQVPSSHLSGVGCPSCARTGFQSSKGGILYVLQSEDITKVGITNLEDSSERARKVSSSYGKTFTILREYPSCNGELIYSVEQEVLRELASLYRQPTQKFEGYTECFYNVNLPILLNRIEELMRKNYDY